jgi:hypothetical protein
VHGRDGIRVQGHLLLDEFVEPPVRQFPGRSGESDQLVVTLLGGEQALSRVVGVRIGGQQGERGEVVAGDPRGAGPVEDVGPVPQPQPEGVAVLSRAHRQHRVVAGPCAGRVQERLEGRSGQTEFEPQGVDREVGVRLQVGLDPGGVEHQPPPRAGSGVHPARHGRPAGAGNVPGHHLVLAGQHGEHLGVRAEEQRVQGAPELVGPRAQRREQVVRDRCRVLRDAGYGIERPAGNRGGPTR